MPKAELRQSKKPREIGKKVLVVMFLLLLYLPGLQQAFHFVPVHPLTEKRKLATRPAFSLASWFSEGYMQAFTRYYNDQSGFREALIRLNNEIYTSVLRVVPNARVILGKKGWLFVNTVVADYQRKYSPADAAAVEGFCRGMGKLQKQLQARDVDLVFIVVPNKNTLYPEYMPDRYVRQPGPSLAERVIAQLQENGVPALFLKAALEKHRGETVLYEPKGTHWNPLGAYYGAAEVLRLLDRKYGVKRNLPEKVGHYYSTNQSNQDTLAMIEHLGGLKGTCAQPKGKIPPGDRKLPPTLWYGDSFCIIPLPYLKEQFESFAYQHVLSDSMAHTLEAKLPGKQLVVFLVAERNVRNALIKQPVAALGEGEQRRQLERRGGPGAK